MRESEVQSHSRRSPEQSSTINDGSRAQLVCEVERLAKRYDISSLRPLIESSREALARTSLSVGILGRFKAGKSTFLNHLAGRNLLPVGVVPVTAVVTEFSGGPGDEAIVEFQDGRTQDIAVEEVAQFVSESENSENKKHVASVRVHIPELNRHAGIRFYDTPGLESALVHNTDVANAWAPNVDIALVAVAVDPPLSQQDLLLIRRLFDFTPRVDLLLTKFDLLSGPEQEQLVSFVRETLRRHFDAEIRIFPYSVRPGYEHLRNAFEAEFLNRLRQDVDATRTAIANRKVHTLIRECGDYLRLILKSSELREAGRTELRAAVIAEKAALTDTKLELQLIAGHALTASRPLIEKILASEESAIRTEITTAFEAFRNSLPKRLDRMIETFQEWLTVELSNRLRQVSVAKRGEFMRPVQDVQRQYVRVLKGFRDQVSDRVMEMYGVPLRTNEPEISIAPPRPPDVKLGRVFDHSQELLSPFLPMTLLRGAVLQRFRRKIGDETFKNLSRLTTQWDDIVRASIGEIQREAERRVHDLVSTIERLTASPAMELDEVRNDIASLDAAAVKILEGASWDGAGAAPRRIS